MMPQKKNPDVAELVRGKTGRVYGALRAFTVLKGLPLAYNKDMQEDKEGLFDTVKTLSDCLNLYAPMMVTLKVNEKAMHNAAQQDYINATEVADYLVKHNVTFRDAHAISGKLVLHAMQQNCYLADLPLTTFREYSPAFGEDIYQALAIEQAVEARKVAGGTARLAVEQQFEIVQKQLVSTEKWLHAHTSALE